VSAAEQPTNSTTKPRRFGWLIEISVVNCIISAMIGFSFPTGPPVGHRNAYLVEMIFATALAFLGVVAATIGVLKLYVHYIPGQKVLKVVGALAWLINLILLVGEVALILHESRHHR
jgi:energy-converting hydrogenase Eha subunit A